MKSILKNSILISISWFAVACNNTEQKKEESTETTLTTSDSVKSTNSTAEKNELQNIDLNYETIIKSEALAKSKLIIANESELYSLEKLDKSYSIENFKYHLFKTILDTDKRSVLLIAREYSEENCMWLAIYNNENKSLEESKQIFYENSEGGYSVTTSIKNNQLIITTYNEFAENESEKNVIEKYNLATDFKLVKI